uniref:Uncharacterized protein n=1 Tax=Anguilla anguilla TaxID=7936 RepID=A0A0E9RE98_ANGAN
MRRVLGLHQKKWVHSISYHLITPVILLNRNMLLFSFKAGCSQQKNCALVILFTVRFAQQRCTNKPEAQIGGTSGQTAVCAA